MFGISKRPEGVPGDIGWKTFYHNRSYLYQGGRDGKIYFFAFFKDPETTVYTSIPRHTTEDCQKLAE
jgi:hypothetical protein